MFHALFTPDVITSVVAAFVTFVVGLFVIASNIHIRSNLVFFLMSLSAVLWIITVLYRFGVTDAAAALFYARITFGAAALVSLGFFYFTYYFPEKNSYRLPQILFIVLAVLLLVLFLSQFTVTDLRIVSGEQVDTYGLGYYLFVIFFPFTVACGLFNLFSKYRYSSSEQKIQIQYIASGVALSLVLGFLTNVIVPLATGIAAPARFGPLTSVIFIIMTAVAIFRHRLFNAKVIATELFVFALWIFILVRAMISDNLSDVVLNGVLFALTLVVGIFLIRSVIREVQQREKIETLAKDLAETNDRQEKLIHFIGHEVKGYLTKGEYAFAELSDGDFGKLSPESQTLVKTALVETQKGVRSVTDILQAANLKRGTVAFTMQPVDLKEMVVEEGVKAKAQAADKKLSFEMQIDESAAPYTVNADKGQFAEHVLRNLMDNSIKYTKEGGITVSLAKKDGKIVFSVKDTGVGISDEDRAHLFTEGGRGKESLKINVHSTGYGLYIAKNITEAHGGTIRMESEGPGKGSTFIVELPSV